MTLALKSFISLDLIKFDRKRMREAGDCEDLALSMLKRGQLHPVTLDADNQLLAGFRRYTAARLNGWSEIWYVDRDHTDPISAREIELEENIHRLDMTWQERDRTIAEIDRLHRLADPNWGQTQTAQKIGGNQHDVSEAIKVVKMMELFPEIAEAKNHAQALTWSKNKAANIARVQEVRDNKVDYADIESKIALGDSVDFIKTMADQSVHHIITDPPFGIGADDRSSGTEGTLTSYADGDDAYRRLLSMAPDCYRVLKPNGFLVWFFGISWYEEVKDAFTKAGFTVDEIPIVWDRSEGRTHTNRPDHYFGRGYDVALHAFKGDPKIVQRSGSNIIRVKPVENSERVTLFERPVDLYGELIKRLTIPGEIVADFFVGGGGCPAAAASLGRDYVGCELDPERRAYAIKKIKAHSPDK